MKYLIFSDIHGSYTAAQTMIDLFVKESYDLMIILGDILYHGPRNPLPEGHNPKEVATLLNAYKDKIICVGGNCDAQVDQMVLTFPCLGDYTMVVDEGVRMFATHGHNYTPDNLSILATGDVFLYGHTHLWELEQRDGCVICNPGSISLPKEGLPATYATYDKGIVQVCTIKGIHLKELNFK